MRATILTLGLAAGLFGTASQASAQWAYPGGYYGGYNAYGGGRGPFVGGRYLATPSYGYGYPSFGGSNYGGYNLGYRSGFGNPGYGYGGGFPAYGGYGLGYRSNFSYGRFR